MTRFRLLQGRRRVPLRILAVVLAAALLAALWGVAYAVGSYWRNGATVIPGVFYRSAQLSAERLEQVVRRHGIRTVINLRGAHPNTPWWEQEQAVLQRLKVQLVNIPLKAYEWPEAEQEQALIRAILDSPKPVLFHCQWGADRTGLASAWAVWLYTQDWPRVQHEIHWRYGMWSARSVARQALQCGPACLKLVVPASPG